MGEITSKIVKSLDNIQHISLAKGSAIHPRPVRNILWDWNPFKEGPYKETTLVDNEGFIHARGCQKVKSKWYEVVLKFEKSRFLRRNLTGFDDVEKAIEQSTNIKPYHKNSLGLTYVEDRGNEVDFITLTAYEPSTLEAVLWPEIIKNYLLERASLSKV